MLSTFFVKPIILQRPFCAIAGVLGGLLLSQAIDYERIANSAGYFSMQTYTQWQQDTGMTRQEIDSAFAIAQKKGLIEVKTDENQPRVIWFRVNHETVDAQLATVSEPVEPQSKSKPEEKKEAPATESSLVVAEKKSPTKKSKKDRTPEELEIDRVFLPLYLEHKLSGWTKHQTIPKDSLKAIQKLIAAYPGDAPQKFVNALTWAREGDKTTDWCREGQWDMDNLIAFKEKLFRFSDAHDTAMENNPEYRARVEGMQSKDIARRVEGIDKSQIVQGQKALNNYMEVPKVVISQEEWDSYA
jgi:hypothetical protein